MVELVVEGPSVDPTNVISGPSDAVIADLAIKEASDALSDIKLGVSNSLYKQPPVNDPVLSTVMSQRDSWAILSARLTRLLGVADQVAEVRQFSG